MALARTLEGVRPFPWRSLEAITRAEESALREVRRWGAAHVRLDRLADVLEDLVGARVDFVAASGHRLAPGSTARSLDWGVAVMLASADTAGPGRVALIEAEGALAATLLARALKRPAPLLFRTNAAPSETVAGAFGAVVVAAVRRAHAGLAVRALEVGAAAALESEIAKLDPELFALSLTVLVADEAFAARVVVTRDAGFSGIVPPWNARVLAGLGAAPLAVPLVACAMLLTPTEVAGLALGDAVVPDSWPLARVRDGASEGPVWLSAPSSELGLRARLCEDGRLVLGAGGLEPLVSRESRMDSNEKNALVEALGDVPILMRAEIGEAVMTAREWASVGPGDVISLGRHLGEPVLLRVGGIAVARAELVDLEGEVAVRIVERLLGKGTTA